MKQQALLADDTIIVGHCTLDPSEKTAQEVHAAMSKTIVVLHGPLFVEISDDWLAMPMRAGDGATIIVPAGMLHGIQNPSPDHTVEFLAIMRKVPT